MMAQIVEEGKVYLGIATGMGDRRSSLDGFHNLKLSPGWVVNNWSIQEWRFSSFCRRGEEIYFYGPHLEGMRLESVLDLPVREALPFFVRLLDAILLLNERYVPFFDLQTDAVLFTDSGGIFFLPPEPMKLLRAFQSFERNVETYQLINHPDLRGEPRLSYAIAALLYRLLTRRFPIPAASEEEMHYRMREFDIIAPCFIVPEFDTDASDAIMSSLGRRRGRALSLEQWRAALKRWVEIPPFHELTREERERNFTAEETELKKANQRYSRRLFWQRNRKTIGAAIAILIFTGIIVRSILVNVWAPRITAGFPPSRVVETFYQSMNTLDQRAIEDCVVGRAGRSEVEEVVNITAFIKIGLGDLNRRALLAADEWNERGRPKLRSPWVMVYGVARLQIKLERGEPEPVYRAEYEKWMPRNVSREDATSQPPFEGFGMTDRLYLKKDRGDWVIYRIDRIRNVRLSS